MPLSTAMVHVEDRGYTFGDGVYEVVRVYDGHPFHLRQHLQRFRRSASAIQLPMVPSRRHWEQLSRKAIALSGYASAKLYLQLTRGAAPREHAFPRAGRPTALITIRPVGPLAVPPRRGVRVVTMPDLRWGRCDIKSINLLPNVLAKQHAKQRRAFETLLVKPGVGVTEGSSSNIFLVTRQGRIVTPPAGPTILSGITRSVAIALARQEGLDVAEAPISLQQLAQAKELFLTGTLTEVVPVVRWDNHVVGNGRPGPVTQWLAAAFRRKVEIEVNGSARSR